MANYTHILRGVYYNSDSYTYEFISTGSNAGSITPSTFLGDTINMITTRHFSGNDYSSSFVFDSYSNPSTKIRITRLDNNRVFNFSWEQSTIYGCRDAGMALFDANDIGGTLYLRIEQV